jgi:hypothetical protein
MAEKKMTKKDAARIQGAAAKRGGGKVESGTFPARAQSAADKPTTKEGKSGDSKRARP